MQDGISPGSGRTVKGYDLLAAFNACKHLVVSGGGHPAAFGMKIRNENIPAFREAMSAAVGANPPKPNEITIDAEVLLAELTMSVVRELERKIGPFGEGNPRPLLAITRVAVVAAPKIMGKEMSHIKFDVRQEPRGKRVKVVAWGKSEWKPDLQRAYEDGAPIDIAFHPEINVWNGSESLQLRAIDWRPSL